MVVDGEWGTVPGLVRWAAERYADVEAVVDSGGRVRVTYGELGARVERAAAACLASGVRTGDRVAIWAPNSLDWIVAALGAVSTGAALVPLNTRFKGTEAADVLRRSGARVLFVTGTFLGTSYVASLRRAAGERWGDGGGESRRGGSRDPRRDGGGEPGPDCGREPGPDGGRDPLRDGGPLPGLPALSTAVVLSGDAPPGFVTWKDFLAGGEGVGAEEVAERAAAVEPGSPSDMVFTSGTTGRPKGVVITHEQTLRAYDTWAELAGLRRADRYLIVNPFFHTFGYKAGVLACLMRGATMIPQPVSGVDTALANVAAERVTVLPGPPALLQSLLDHPRRGEWDLSSLRLVVTGAAVIPLRLVERLRSELAVETVLTAYGLSEATGVVTMCRRDDPAEVIASTSGRAIPGVEVRVVNQEGDAVPPGTPGEVLVRGYNVMRGYHDDPAATAEALTDDGWLHTGDIGVLSPTGNLRITDRLKDMFIVGGFNAYPAEIERLLCLHPDVTDAAVIGIPDTRLGEVGKAYVIPRPGSQLTPDTLIAWSRREMANFKVPRRVEFVDEFPRNASGKVLKGNLRARHSATAD